MRVQFLPLWEAGEVKKPNNFNASKRRCIAGVKNRNFSDTTARYAKTHFSLRELWASTASWRPFSIGDPGMSEVGFRSGMAGVAVATCSWASFENWRPYSIGDPGNAALGFKPALARVAVA